MNTDHIALAIASTGVPTSQLSPEERGKALERLRSNFQLDAVGHRAPWDSADAPDGQLRPAGWELIPTYVGNSPCILFLADSQTLWALETGDDLLSVLKDCPALEFYVCDREATYLLCMNHHDFVIGWGAAEEWVAGL